MAKYSNKIVLFSFWTKILRWVNSNYFKSLFRNNFWSKIIVFGSKTLALVPPEIVLPIWEELKNISKDINDNFLNEYVEYFQKEWINSCDIIYWNYYNDFINRTNNFSESFSHKINCLFNRKKTKLYFSIYNYKILINESLDKYHKLVEVNGSDEIIFNPFKTKAKNIYDKFELDYKNLKS